MKLSIAHLRNDRHWRSATGLDQKQFAKLLSLFPEAYEKIYGQSIEQRQAECPEQPTLSTYEELLLFTLFSRSGTPAKISSFLRFIGLHH